MSEDVKKDTQLVQKGSLEFRLISPTEDGFLQRIKWNREELEKAVRDRISAYENVVYSEENLRQAKADRAELNNLLKAIEERRKKVKDIINAPYAVFEKEIKEVLRLVREPVGMIDEQIKGFENQQREEKKGKIREAYDENIGDLLSVLPFEKLFDTRYLNKSYKLNSAIAEVKSKIEGVKRDLDTIDSLDSKYRLNVKDYYLKTLDLSKALAENKRLLELEEKLEAEKQRKAEEKKHRESEESGSVVSSYFKTADSDSTNTQSKENVPYSDKNVPKGTETVPARAVAEPFEDEPVTEEKKYRTRFYAIGTRQQLNKLKEYMEEHGIRYGKVE